MRLKLIHARFALHLTQDAEVTTADDHRTDRHFPMRLQNQKNIECGCPMHPTCTCPAVILQAIGVGQHVPQHLPEGLADKNGPGPRRTHSFRQGFFPLQTTFYLPQPQPAVW